MADNSFLLKITTPDGKKFEENVEMANFTLSDGDIGIMKGHLPLVGVIEISIMNYKKGNTFYPIAISGGILQVSPDKINVLADAFETKDELNFQRALKAKQKAEDDIKNALNDSSIDVLKAELALKRALNRMKLNDIK